MCITDKHPTEYNLTKIKLTTTTTTDVENKAMRIVSAVERVNDPITIYDVARIIIRLSARLSRALRRA